MNVNPITRDDKIAGLARYLADMPADERRRDFLARLMKHHGSEFTAEVRRAAWAEIRRREGE